MTEHKLTGQLKFDVQELLSVAPKFEQAGEWVGNGVQDVTSALLDLGNFWGNDKPGTAFGDTAAGSCPCMYHASSPIATPSATNVIIAPTHRHRVRRRPCRFSSHSVYSPARTGDGQRARSASSARRSSARARWWTR